MPTPKYYHLKVSLLDWAKSHNIDFIVGNIMKYIVRADKKDGNADIDKAIAYSNAMEAVKGVRKSSIAKIDIPGFIALNDGFFTEKQITAFKALASFKHTKPRKEKLIAALEALKLPVPTAPDTALAA